MTPIIAWAILGLLATLFVLWCVIAMFRWWTKPYHRPAKLYRQLKRFKRISRDEEKKILEAARANTPDPRKRSIDWVVASRELLDSTR